MKVAGVLGPAAPAERKSGNVADVQVGIGGTTLWKLAGLVRPLVFALCPAVARPLSTSARHNFRRLLYVAKVDLYLAISFAWALQA